MAVKKKLRKCGFSPRKPFLPHVHLVDKCLMVFMIILLLQSAFTLFTDEYIIQEANSIDIIVRTSMASIFGYFLSTNFARKAKGKTTTLVSSEKNSPDQQELETPPEQPFDPPIFDPYTADPMEEELDVAVTGKLQIIVAASLGIFCLLVLILMRNLVDWSTIITDDATNLSATSAAATVGQFRDFVSGCVGFLIGCPGNALNSK